MSLDYFLHITIKKDQVDDALVIIKSYCSSFEIWGKKGEGMNYNTYALSMIFEEDEFITEYFLYLFDEEGNEMNKIEKKKRSIGIIYLWIDENNPEELELSFNPSVSLMSKLFAKSESIINTFKEISIKLDSSYCYLDMYPNGVKDIFGSKNT